MAQRPDKEPLNEDTSTYIVQDRSNEEELLRLDWQDRLFTACVGGVLPEQADPNRFQRVLDIGCGPGGWLLETAMQYPEIPLLVGVDISERMINYARRRVEKAVLGHRMQFQTGDALRMLEFPDQFFDLVNMRFGMSWLRKEDWPGLLRELGRVTRPDGTIRITEASVVTSPNPATSQLLGLLTQALHLAGHFITPDHDDILSRLAEMMSQYGIEQVQTKISTLAFHSDPPIRYHFAEDLKYGFRTVKPFLQKWDKLPANYEEIYQQMIQETQQPDFQATQMIQVAWGIWEPTTPTTALN